MATITIDVGKLPTDYEIQPSEKEDFSEMKNLELDRNIKSFKVKNLKKNKVKYIRIRGYQKGEDENYYTEWYTFTLVRI